MRYSFTKKDVLFSRNGLAGEAREERKKKDEERGRRHSNTSYSSSVWLKVEESGRCIVPEIQALTHRRLLSVCVFPGHG